MFGLLLQVFALLLCGMGVIARKLEGRPAGAYAFATGVSLLGGLLIAHTTWRAWRAVRLVDQCRVAWATVVAIPSDKTVKHRGRHPRQIRYLFMLPGSGEKIRGTGPHLRVHEEALWKVGDKLRIAYHSENPLVNTPMPRR